MVQNTTLDLLSSTGYFLLDLGRVILITLVYLLIAHFASRFLISLARKSTFLARYGQNGEMIAFRMISILAYGIAAIALLNKLGFHTTGILTLLSAFTVAIGLALQDVMRNFISGLFMLAEKPFAVGDRVSVRNHEGTVQGIDIRTTMLRTDDGSLLMVPNSMMFTEILRNESRYNMRTVRYNITTKQSAAEVEVNVAAIIDQIEGLRTSHQRPLLMHHDGSATKWQVSFVVNQKQLAKDLDIANALMDALPEATIERVVPA